MNEPSGTEAKPRQRSAAEIRADIERERAELAKAFESLRGELDEAVDAGKERADQIARKARVVGPVVAGLVVSGIVARMLLRRRSKEE